MKKGNLTLRNKALEHLKIYNRTSRKIEQMAKTAEQHHAKAKEFLRAYRKSLPGDCKWNS